MKFEFTNAELCTIQQALGLREMTIINAEPLRLHKVHLAFTQNLRRKVVNYIQEQRRNEHTPDCKRRGRGQWECTPFCKVQP